jgi:hypothetical protein
LKNRWPPSISKRVESKYSVKLVLSGLSELQGYTRLGARSST